MKDLSMKATTPSFSAFTSDLLSRAQKCGLEDVHARMLAEAESEILTFKR